MTTKTNGAELKAFYNDDKYWRSATKVKEGEVWYEELVLLVNGIEQDDDFSITDSIKDEDGVSILGGVVLSEVEGFSAISFESFFKAWRKQQNTVHLSVAVPKEKLEAVRAAIRAAGGKVK